MTLDDLKTTVKKKVDEHTPDGVALSFDDQLETVIQEAADELSDRAPKHLLEPSAISTSGIKYENDLAYIPVPSAYARLYAIKFGPWEKTVFEAISPEHPAYAIQQNTHTKAGYSRPVVMIQTDFPSGGALQKYLVCGKCLDGATVQFARCIEYRTAQTMPDVLDEALTWLAASKLLMIMGYGDQAGAALQSCNNELDTKQR